MRDHLGKYSHYEIYKTYYYRHYYRLQVYTNYKVCKFNLFIKIIWVGPNPKKLSSVHNRSVIVTE